mmetsp:Transcript_4819/g.7425  ORF Transcript_4819/g.7425 Transcript_4819/m.7425 type:complete len:662 (-) Transcript_4819:860-2845(-)|eukprot:CAMPEP_0201733078 /NCGR_PEP_ID=MMETSP0593-20130828/30585_1 /ASSEMBLY_ACC=CAM_ASM_000672 /TAXON_ID=267983 /ORGANISM="Skeletonema japonicum, Strain CCMP2506" /LENGTH=661 /DNA_ID=CAMNT_0048226163 /DNA_START=134 /DNA_END=2119 /DNA_ORIENTATION=-
MSQTGEFPKYPENGDVDDSTQVPNLPSMPMPSNKKPNQMVDHTYTDYAIISKEVDVKLLEEESPQLPDPRSEKESAAREKLKAMSCTYGPMRKNAGGVTQPFPGKLMEVLNRSDLAEIIEWMPHGRAFLVKQPKTFASQVLPRFFKQSKYLSFTRQLNLWGFKRITRGKDMGAYYHEIFLRGRTHLAMRMKRQKIKGTGMKLTPNPDSEPDFYTEYPIMPRLEQSQDQGPLPPLPAERMGMLHQAAAADVSSQNLFKALKVASSQQQSKMQPAVLSHPQLQQIHQQQQLVNMNAAGGRMMPGANSDYHRLLGAMNASAGVNTMFSAETLHQLKQQQQSLQQKQQQLHHAVKGTNGPGIANGGYNHLYGAMNSQSGINPMLAAASQLPSMIPSAMLPSGMLPSANFTTHIAKRAYDDVLLAPGVRKQLGFSASGLQNGNAPTGSMGGSFSGNFGVKDKISSVMLQLNNGAVNPGQFAMTTPQVTQADLMQTAQSQTSQPKAKDDVADAATTIAEGGAVSAAVAAYDVADAATPIAGGGVVAPPATTAGAAATKASKPSTPSPENETTFAGYGNDPLQDALKKVGNDPLQDALQKVHQLDDDAASLQRAKAKILQSMAQSGVDPTDDDDEEKKNGGDSSTLDEKRPDNRPSLGRPFVPRNSDD